MVAVLKPEQIEFTPVPDFEGGNALGRGGSRPQLRLVTTGDVPVRDLLAPATLPAPVVRPALPVRPASVVEPTPQFVYWARRAAVLVALVLVALAVPQLVSVGAEAVGSLLGLDGPQLAVDAPSAYVVQPGDTVWSVARALQPEGDVRPLVDALVDLDGDGQLAVGQVLQLDALR